MGRPAMIMPQGTGERAIDGMRLNQLKGHHRSMARDLVAGGLRNKELANLYDMTESQISIIVNSPLFIAEVSRLETDIEDDVLNVREEIKVLAPRARRIISREMIGDEDQEGNVLSFAERKHQTNIAFEVLDRAGGGLRPVPESGGVHLHKHEEIHIHKMSDEDLAQDVLGMVGEV